MASFVNDVSKSSFDANSKVTDFISGRVRSGGNSSYTTHHHAPQSEYSVVGMNTSGIPVIKDAIVEYVTAITNVLDEFNTGATVSQAIKGTEMETAVANYVQKVSEYTKSLCTYIYAFRDKLTDVQKAWETNVANMAQAVNSGVGDLDAASTKYQA